MEGATDKMLLIFDTKTSRLPRLGVSSPAFGLCSFVVGVLLALKDDGSSRRATRSTKCSTSRASERNDRPGGRQTGGLSSDQCINIMNMSHVATSELCATSS